MILGMGNLKYMSFESSGMKKKRRAATQGNAHCRRASLRLEQVGCRKASEPFVGEEAARNRLRCKPRASQAMPSAFATSMPRRRDSRRAIGAQHPHPTLPESPLCSRHAKRKSRIYSKSGHADAHRRKRDRRRNARKNYRAGVKFRGRSQFPEAPFPRGHDHLTNFSQPSGRREGWHVPKRSSHVKIEVEPDVGHSLEGAESQPRPSAMTGGLSSRLPRSSGPRQELPEYRG